jgi:hypothetical protein
MMSYEMYCDDEAYEMYDAYYVYIYTSMYCMSISTDWFLYANMWAVSTSS